MEYLKKVQGGLLGLALGDAFGYEVEKMSYDMIINKYGDNGICEFNMKDGYAHFSDDTQLTLYSADGIAKESDKPLEALYASYFDWLYTQLNLIYGDGTLVYRPLSKLVEIPELNELRRPNLTNLNALFKCKMGTEEMPLNDCDDIGSLIRSAPIAMYYAKKHDLVYTANLVKDASYITHGSKVCAIASYYLGALLYRILQTNDSLKDIITLSIKDAQERFEDSGAFVITINEAMKLVDNDSSDVCNIESIGIGYNAYEAIAIALYIVLKYQDDFKKAIYTGANHSGKSDTVASLVGLIIGTYYGIDVIPDEYLGIIELEDLIIEYAEKLAK